MAIVPKEVLRKKVANFDERTSVLEEIISHMGFMQHPLFVGAVFHVYV